MTPRPATAADVAAVAALERELFGPDAWSTASCAEELVGTRRIALVVGDPVVGYAVRTAGGHGDDPVDLLRIGVTAEHRRHGVAHELLVALGAGAGRVLLEVGAGNAGALAFYAAEGFVPIDRRRRYYRDGSDALVLERRPD